MVRTRVVLPLSHRASPGAVGQMALGGQLAQQKMKIDEAAEGLEIGQDPAHPRVIQGFFEIQPGLQLAAGAHVVAGEQVGAAQAPQQGVLRRPAADALEAAQGLNRGVVIQGGEIIQAEAAVHQTLGKFDDGPGLAVTETQVPQGLGLQPRQVLRAGGRRGPAPGRPETATPKAWVRRLRTWMPTVRLICWQAMALTRASKRLG